MKDEVREFMDRKFERIHEEGMKKAYLILDEIYEDIDPEKTKVTYW